MDQCLLRPMSDCRLCCCVSVVVLLCVCCSVVVRVLQCGCYVVVCRWEDAGEGRDEGVKWSALEHCGPVFAEAYERLPSDVHFYYNGRAMQLSDLAEEVAGFYARMLDHDYTTREIFNSNFIKDWRKVHYTHSLTR